MPDDDSRNRSPDAGSPAAPIPVVATRRDPLAPIELEESTTPVRRADDHRPKLEEPLPVQLVAVADVTLPTLAGLEPKLDALYVAVLLFAKEQGGSDLAYRAENFSLRFHLVDGTVIERQSVRPLGIIIPSLAVTEKKLVELEIDYFRQRGLLPGSEELLLQDPAGNWLTLTEQRAVG
jgi:hypothetical protein